MVPQVRLQRSAINAILCELRVRGLDAEVSLDGSALGHAGNYGLSKSSGASALLRRGTYTPSNGGVTSKSTAYSFYRNMNWGTPLPDFFRRQLEARCVERHEGIDWGYHNECASGAIAFLG